MKNLELASPSEMSARTRAGEITAILAAAIVRTVVAEAPKQREVGLGFLPEQLAAAWSGGQSNAHLIHGALSAKFGKPLPWARAAQALDEAFRLGLIERCLDSASWPCDMGGASAVKIRISKERSEAVAAAEALRVQGRHGGIAIARGARLR
jgi:hypothetical protein